MSRCHSFKLIIPLVTLVTLFSACATQMSLEEAKKVTISTGQKSFTPPPRRVHDVLSILNQPGQFDDTITNRLKAKADAPPPKEADEGTLANFYYDRGLAARNLGRSKQAVEDFRMALRYRDKVIYLARLLNYLASEEKVIGNFKLAIELAEESMSSRGMNASVYALLTDMYLQIGDLESAQRIITRGLSGCNMLISRNMGADYERVSCRRVMANLEYLPLEAQGRFSEAESKRRDALYWANNYAVKSMFTQWYISERIGLTENLFNQGKLMEAETEARETLREALGLGSKDSESVSTALMVFGSILMGQGRLGEAEELFRASIRTMEALGLSPQAGQLGKARMAIGIILTAREDYAGAMKQFDMVHEGMRENQYLYDAVFARNPNLIISLLKAGRVEDARRSIDRAFEISRKYLGEHHPGTLEIIGLRGMAYAAQGDDPSALQDFSSSIPFLLQHAANSALDYEKKQRLRVIFESYIDFLARIDGTALESKTGIQATAEAFKVANTMSGQALYGAVGESSARAAAAHDPELSNLVRQEQDAQKEIMVLNVTLSNLSATPADQQITKGMKELRARIDTLTKARVSILNEIHKRFPKYTDFVNPRIATVESARSSLRPGETLILVYSTEIKTFVWAIPHQGKMAFHVAFLGKKEIGQTVASLRKALEIDRITLGDIPDFNLSLAYTLYGSLLKPVDKAWKDSPDLLVVVNGPLGQLPLSVLPTTDMKLSADRNILFSRYRQVPWLIRTATITMLPSVSSLITFRSVTTAESDRKAFVGFGDPLFNREQLAQAESEERMKSMVMASRGGKLNIRGVRITQKGNLDDQKLISTQLAQLDRLPDTAEEIRSVAHALGADLTKDVFLRKKASVSQIKGMNLYDRKVISFATHALVPGDLDGLDQPALALSSPVVTGDNDDGLLTMGEVLKLKMNADWVILSACNTAAAEGTAAEALSGLVRAFFYAGTRSILASMYPVESTSAKTLVTGIFQSQNTDKSLSRPGALQKSMLTMIDDTNLVDETTGKVAASYAHPLFWAPFILVGEPK